MRSTKFSTKYVVLAILVAVLLAACAPLAPEGQGGNDPFPNVPAPEGAVEVIIASSNTKEDWMNEMVAQFNAANNKVSTGESIFVRVSHVTSGGSKDDILDGTIQPTVWSPGDQSWIDSANQVWDDRNSRPLIPDSCAPTVLAPIGFAMWRPMAEALGWPNEPISWGDLVNLAADPDGWASKGHPEWGAFKAGTTHPEYSNTGKLMYTALAYSELNMTSGLTAADVYGPRVENAFRDFGQTVYHYGKQNRPLVRILATNGPNYLHAITSSEAEVLKTNEEFGDTMRFPLVFVFPSKGTYWSGQPYCILDTEWVTDQHAEAAGIFRDFILARPQQELAIDYYLRPTDESIPLHEPFGIEYGTNPDTRTTDVVFLESPTDQVSGAIIDVFKDTKKPATTVLVIDGSGSMSGDKIAQAVESSKNFIDRLHPSDEIYVVLFNGQGVRLLGGGLARDHAEDLKATLSGVFADGGTPLYDAICDGVELIDSLAAADLEEEQKRLYGVVVLSDGDNTSGWTSQNQMFSTCLPTGEAVDGVKVFTIAYGFDANAELLARIANRTNGKPFTGDPQSIENVYIAISAEQ